MNDSAEDQNASDVELVRTVLAGSPEAWKRFVDRYAVLILAVLRRYLRDEDDARDVFVEVLEGLFHRKLSTYAGRSRLSTWLVVVTRRAAVDHLRRQFGRRHRPRCVSVLDPLDREIFRLYHVEGQDFETVRHWARRGGEPLSTEELSAHLSAIAARLDDRALRHLSRDLHGSSVGALSARMLEFLDLQELEARAAGDPSAPDLVLHRMEARETAAAIRAALDQLPEQERRILLLRFDQGWTARRIATELDLAGEQRVYTLIRKSQRTLRRLLGGRGRERGE